MVRPAFPHFTPAEAEVLQAFQQQNILDGKWSYDVRLKTELPERFKYEPENYRKMWEALLANRIDALCETKGAIHIIEVKKYLHPSGIGQLLNYRRMYIEQFKPKKAVEMWLIAKYPNIETVETCSRYGIRTWTME